MAFAVLLLLLAAYSNAAPAINYMTPCERMLHQKCIVDIASSMNFRTTCKIDKLLSCFRSSLELTMCTKDDKETIPTIKRLIGMTVRKLKNDPKFCKNDQKYNGFIVKLENTITVQGEGIEFTEPRDYQEYSGSGDSTIPDDTEDGEDDDGDNNDNDTVVQKKDQKKNSKENIVHKGSKFWKEKSRLIMKGKNDRKVQMLVYFDDHNRNKNKKTLTNAETVKLEKAWVELKRRYQRWYKSSKYNKVKK